MGKDEVNQKIKNPLDEEKENERKTEKREMEKEK